MNYDDDKQRNDGHRERNKNKAICDTERRKCCLTGRERTAKFPGVTRAWTKSAKNKAGIPKPISTG